MMRNHFVKKIQRGFAAVCLVWLSLTCMTARAGEETGPLEIDIPNQPVRVGYYPQDGFHDFKNGKPSGGYGYDYLQHLRQYAPWVYDYQAKPSDWPDALQMLLDGKIDLLVNMRKTPKREERLAFSKIPMGQSSTILTVKSGDTRYHTGDYANWKGIRIGVPRSVTMRAQLEALAREKGFTYTEVQYEGLEEMLEDLRSGKKIDAALSNNLRRLHDEWLLEQMSVDSFYIVVRKDNTRLLAQLDSWTVCLKNMPLIMFIKSVDDDFRYLECNENYAQFLGKNINEIIGKTDANLLKRKEDVEYIQQHDIETIKAKHPVILHETVADGVGRTGHYMTVKFQAERLDGKSVLVGMALDETEDYNRRQTLDNMLDDWEKVANVACIGSYRVDRDMHVLSATDRMTQFWPVGADGKPLSAEDYLLPEDTATYNHMYESVFNGEQEQASMLCRIPHPDGMRYLRLFIHYISVKGKPWGCLGFITRGHTVKHLSVHEANLLKVTAHIVELAITRKRVMDKLSSALNNALAADKAKTFFLSSMSHEIRTPLNAVIGFTDLLKDPELDQETRDDYLNSVADASQALLTLLNNILELSKLSSSKVQALPVMTDMQKFMNETGAIFRPGARQKQLELEISAYGVPHLFVDQPQLRQILFNLIGNAIKFTHEGGVKALLAFAREDVDYGELTIQVTDTGIGIAPEDRQKMFEPFVQMSRMRGTNASGTGTGLGMAIVKKIVEQEGGELYLDSEVGRSSTFTIVIPKVYMHPTKKEPEQEIMPELPSGAAKPEKHSKIPRVLIVDDAEMALEILSRMLNWMHVPYMKASSAQEALDILREEDFDIRMTDLLMPGMSGAELAAVRANPRGADMRIVAMSTENESIMYGKKLFHKVMLKPIIRNVLHDEIFGKDSV